MMQVCSIVWRAHRFYSKCDMFEDLELYTPICLDKTIFEREKGDGMNARRQYVDD